MPETESNTDKILSNNNFQRQTWRGDDLSLNTHLSMRLLKEKRNKWKVLKKKHIFNPTEENNVLYSSYLWTEFLYTQYLFDIIKCYNICNLIFICVWLQKDMVVNTCFWTNNSEI